MQLPSKGFWRFSMKIPDAIAILFSDSGTLLNR